MNQTTNYNLNLPEGRDIVDIEVLNENFTTLDTQLKTTDNRVTTVNSSLSSSINSTKTTLQNSINSTKTSLQNSIDDTREDCTPVTGTYTGDGAESRTISLGFQPSFVIVTWYMGFYDNLSGLALRGAPVTNTYGTQLAVASNGFTVYYREGGGSKTNVDTNKYYYVAWR